MNLIDLPDLFSWSVRPKVGTVWRSAVAGVLAVAWIFGGLPALAEPDKAQLEFFENSIRPLLVDRCYSCHSSKSEKGLKGGLSLETRDGILKGGENGPALVPGDPDRSLIIRAVRYTDEHLQMPPKNKKLSPEEVGRLEAWVKMGAPDPRSGAPLAAVHPNAAQTHWAFQPIQSPPVPEVKNKEQVRNPIDAFVLAKLEPKGLKISKEADRRTLIRRLSFDLTGLPPTPQEVHEFISDGAPNAYEKCVDRLLASPRYGERWGRYWLDIARYADTKGYVFEEERRYPYSYTYRDYVIRAFNEDVPFDRFVREQLAADLMPLGADRRPLAAMGFMTLGRRFLNNEADIIDDRIDVMSRGLMGLTVGCARCHDHKFDPISTKDYYSLYGVFASSQEPDDKPLLGDASLPKEYPEYVREREKRVQEKASYREACDAEALLKVRSQFGDYLLLTRDSLSLSNSEAREKLARERKLEPVVAAKFMDRYSEWSKSPPPVLKPWFQFVSLKAENFAAESQTLLEGLKSETAVAGLLARCSGTNAPTQLQQVADRWNQWFAQAGKEMATRATNQSFSVTETALVEFLGSDRSPLQLNPDELHRLFPTPQQQKLRALQRKIVELDATHPGAPPRAMALADKPQPYDPHVFKRGNPGNVGDAVPRQFLEVLSGKNRKPFQKGSGRLEMADAIVDAKNPLTARVWVNRVWNYHLGSPFVRTPSDFGLRSDPPSHPELLDYLAARFIEEGWSVKKLHRWILTSAAYRQSSDEIAAAAKVDPGNQLFWRQNRKRLDFESMRDSLLSVSGLLDLNGGGHPVEITTEPFATKRTIYGFVERQNLPGLFRTFDFASPDSSSPQRFTTTVPQQALFLMNSPFVIQQARAVMGRTEVQAKKKDSERVKELYEILYQRRPESEELKLGLEFLKTETPPKAPVKPAWEYGYGTVDENSGKTAMFTPLPHFNHYAWQGGKELPDSKLGWVLLNANGGHPGKNPGFAAIRRWMAPMDGKVQLSAQLEHPAAEGDGVRARVISSRSGVLGTWVAHHSKTNTTLETIAVRAGDVLDFVTDCRENEGYDSFLWAPRLTYLDANSKAKEPSGGKSAGQGQGVPGPFSAQDDFRGPTAPEQKSITAWEKYAQALLLSNEFLFVD